MVFREVRNYKGAYVRRKTQGEYEKLFETLMRFTDFTSVKDIKTQTDLNEFFEANKRYSSSRGYSFNVTRLFKDEMVFAFKRLIGKPAKRIITRTQAVVEGRIFTSYAKAREYNMLAVNKDNVEVYKTYITLKGRKRVRYRDKKGIFRKKPEA